MTAGLMAKVSEANKAIFILERLEDERVKWEKNELAASRQRLYGMLTDCYEFYLTMKTDKNGDVREQMKKGLETFSLIFQICCVFIFVIEFVVNIFI
jgi:hypothetical protein